MSASQSAAQEWKMHWPLPLAAALGYATSVLHIYSLGPFIEPLQQEFAWSRAEITGGITIASIGSAIFAIPVGMLIDRIGPRIIGLVGAALMCALFALLSTATGDIGNWLMLWGVIVIGVIWVQATAWTSAVATRFEASRGLAFAVTLCGASLATTIFPILATTLIDAHGWRTALVQMGAIWAAIVLPILFLFFRGARDQKRKEPKAAAATHGLTLQEGLRSPALYKLLIASGFFSFTIIAAVVHFVPILKDEGTDPLAAAGIASLIGVFSIIGRLGTGFFLDRFPARLVGAVAFLIPIAACGLLLFSGANPVSQMAAAAIFGLTLGSEVDVIAYLAARQFGLKNFGALYGALTTALTLGTAFGPLAAGTVYDQTGSYDPFLMLTIVLMSISSLAVASLGNTHDTKIKAGETA